MLISLIPNFSCAVYHLYLVSKLHFAQAHHTYKYSWQLECPDLLIQHQQHPNFSDHASPQLQRWAQAFPMTTLIKGIQSTHLVATCQPNVWHLTLISWPHFATMDHTWEQKNGQYLEWPVHTSDQLVTNCRPPSYHLPSDLGITWGIRDYIRTTCGAYLSTLGSMGSFCIQWMHEFIHLERGSKAS